ncbi:MAG: hypothetical protein H6Q73_2322 [Firmicutes bacterium]|nr:hypothetical protein [Bacillota bacterium]
MILVNNVFLDFPSEMTEAEATEYAKEELQLWNDQQKELDRIIIKLEKDEVIIQAFEKSPIKRIRRITGYLSEVNNFNDAKRAELADRVIHV